MSVAVNQHCVSNNVAEGIVLPQIERKSPNPLTDVQLAQFVNRIKFHEKRDIFLFALLTGLRESEIIGLTIDCFNNEENTLNVYRQLNYNNRKHIYEFTSLKNSKSRVLSLTQQAHDILERLCSDTSTYNIDNFIFKNRNNKHFTPAALYNSLKKVVKSIGYPKVTFHDLRHTHAVLSLKAGMDIKTLQYNLGHYSAAFTLDVYNDKKEGGEALLEAFKNAVMKNISGKTSVGSYQGFEIKAMFDALSKCYVAELHGHGAYTVQLGSSETGNFTRLDNALNAMQTNCENAKERYDNLCQQLEDAKQQLDKPFSREEELSQKEARLKDLTKLLDIDSQNEIKTAEITAPYYIEINSEMLEKMKNSSINFEHIETDGHLILKINESDKDRVHDIIDVPALKPKI